MLKESINHPFAKKPNKSSMETAVKTNKSRVNPAAKKQIKIIKNNVNETNFLCSLHSLQKKLLCQFLSQKLYKSKVTCGP